MIKCPKCGSESWDKIEQGKIYSKKSLISFAVVILALIIISKYLNANFMDALIPAAIAYLIFYLYIQRMTILKCNKCGKAWRQRGMPHKS